MSLNLNGVIAALPTPFNESGEVDHDKLRLNLEKWNQTDLLGYLILGSTGEFPHLTTDEKIAIIDTVRNGMSYEKVLLVGTGELSTRQTIEMTRKAHEYGADAAVVITPFYYKKVLHDEHHEAHYRRIADNSPVPVLIYMIPQFAGVTLMPETIASLAEHDNIAGLKESSGDLDSLRDIFRELKTDNFKVMLGGPSIFTQGMEAGAAGSIFAVAAIAPKACVAMDHAHHHRNFEYADDLQKRLSKLARVTAGSGVGHLKAAMDMVGMYGFLARSPLPSPSDSESASIDLAIEESGFYEKDENGNWRERDDLIGPVYYD